MNTFDKNKKMGQQFHSCDLEGPGLIDKDDMASMYCQLFVYSLSDVFKKLDIDDDGRISIEELANSYREIAMAKETKKRQMIRERLANAKPEDNLIVGVSTTNSAEEFASGLDEGLRSLSCQEEVCELYQNLHTFHKPELVGQFENILLSVINDVQQYQMENERLERTYIREKDEHEKHLRRMEEEMEQQVQSVEERVRKQEKDRLELEKTELRNQLDSEIIMLQQSLKKLQQDGEGKLDKEEYLVTLKKRLEEVLIENRMLKSELTDAQTNLALIKSQMTTVKHQLDDKSFELEVENKTVTDYVNELDNLRRQLQMLHEQSMPSLPASMHDPILDSSAIFAPINNPNSQITQLKGPVERKEKSEANKNLLDTNDNLREFLDTTSNACPVYKRTSSLDSARSSKSGRSPSTIFPRKVFVTHDVLSRDIPHLGQSLRADIVPKFITENDTDDNLAEDLCDHHSFLSPDSGHSTLRDGNEVNDDSEVDSISLHCDIRTERRHRHLHSSSRMHEDELDSHSEMDTDTERPDSPWTEPFRLQVGRIKRSSGSRDSNRSLLSSIRDEFFNQSSKSSMRGSNRRQLPAIPTQDVTLSTKVFRDPERMYKLVLAGDAAVGKSSFIVRLCKGMFVPNLSTTLGVDFQTKMLDIDGRPTALQLWDTAGQERFRSVARTYFRRADGVLLLYDVTYERSFLNIREWISVIEQGSPKKIPLMLVGNKTDARSTVEQQGRRVVKLEDGLRLSREINSLFIETSAKEGANIYEAVIELTRLLRTNEDIEVKTVGMQLQGMDYKRSGPCCKRA